MGFNKGKVLSGIVFILVILLMFAVLVRIVAVPLYPRAKVFAEWLGIEAGFEEEKDFEELSDSDKKVAAEEFYEECYTALYEGACKSPYDECDDAFEVCKDVKRDYMDDGDFERIKTKIWSIINHYNSQIRLGKMFDEKIEILELAYEIKIIKPYSYWFYLGEIYSNPDYSGHDYDRAVDFLKKTLDDEASSTGNFDTQARSKIEWICWYTESQGISQPSICQDKEEYQEYVPSAPEWIPPPLEIGDTFGTFAEDHPYAGLELMLIIKEDGIHIAKIVDQEIYFKLEDGYWEEIEPPVTVPEGEGSIKEVFADAGYEKPNFEARKEWFYRNYGTEVEYIGSEYQNRDQMLRDLKDGTKLLFKNGYPLKG